MSDQEAENPDPEEDSDLPCRQNNGEEEEDEPEDSLLSRNCVEEEAGSPEHFRSSENQAEVVGAGVEANTAGTSNPELEGGYPAQVEQEGVESQNVGEGPDNPIQVDPEEEEGQIGDREVPGEEDSFEQDEAIAAPECESELIGEEICSESDRQLQDEQSLAERIQQVVTENRNAQDMAEEASVPQVVAEESSVSQGLPNGGDATAAPDNAEAGSAIPPGAFSGDVQVVNTLEDAPEAELDGLNEGSSAEEGSAQFSQSAQQTTEGDHLSGAVITPVVDQHSDQDIGVPECDRAVVIPRPGASTPPQPSIQTDNSVVSSPEHQVSAPEYPVSSAGQQSSSSEPSSNGSDSVPVLNPSDCDHSVTVNSVPANVDRSTECDHQTEDSVPQQLQGAVSANCQSEANLASNDLQINSSKTDACDIESEKSENQQNPNGDSDSQQTAVSTETDNASPSHVQSNSSVDSNFNDINGASPPPPALTNSSPQQLATPPSRTRMSSVERVLSQSDRMDSASIQRELKLALHSDDEEEDDILAQLDSELIAHSSARRSSPSEDAHGASPRRADPQLVNGFQASFEMSQLQKHNRELLDQLRIRDEEIVRLTQERNARAQELHALKSHSQTSSPSHNADDLYLPQIKALESTITQLQNEVKASKEKLTAHDTAAKRAVTSLQNELKSRVDQITKTYEDCRKEKDMMVVKFAESEAKNLEYKRHAEKCEGKMKEAVKEKDSMANALKLAKADRHRAGTNFEIKCAELSNLQKELEKMKETANSTDYRMKWFQNKLKDELESHKETKSNVEKMNGKLKEAREETEMIRKECQAIVKRYQESEEIKSNSLDKELKLKESELKLQMQERTDTEEVHQMTKRELDSLKNQHKDILEEAKTLKDKVHCLDEERQQNHQMIEKYQEIMQRQKSDNADLKAQLNGLSTVDEDFKRAQEMIKSLDGEMEDLKISNKDLQKDMDLCRERESKMLSLQSELSKTNALLRSENTSLSNKVSTLTTEVEKLRMEVQELEATTKDMGDKYEDEKSKREEEVKQITTQLDEKTKEGDAFRQKWEDEVDSSKTLKRRHANNVKDLTRQLHQAKKKLESLEGKADGGSMGSRTNSNGSLNSIDNTNAQQPSVQQPPPQEFPVITEQVEVDKQVLIERIVRLQKSLARKNEKLEFLGEHIQQLLEEIKKKNKIIQSYVLREEAGTLSSEDMDANKAFVNKEYKLEAIREIQSLLSRKGGIMASVYSLHQQDGTMTLDLSLQINRKLQAVLEDTLLKNITLKENLDTLGEEIARLSQTNRKLQLHLQDLEKN